MSFGGSRSAILDNLAEISKLFIPNVCLNFVRLLPNTNREVTLRLLIYHVDY